MWKLYVIWEGGFVDEGKTSITTRYKLKKKKSESICGKTFRAQILPYQREVSLNDVNHIV